MPVGRKFPLAKNEVLDITVHALSSDGSGVGHINGYVVFVPGALAGEHVRVQVIKLTNRYAVALIRQILTPSPDRVPPCCKVHSACGGCMLQHLSYPAQLAHKQRVLVDALTRIGGFDHPCVLPVLGMNEPWRYRNKGSFSFEKNADDIAFGLYAARSHRLVPIQDCPIQDERVLNITRRVTSWACENHIPLYDEKMQTGTLRHVMVRISNTGETLAILVTKGDLPKRSSLLPAFMDIDSFWHNRNDQNTNVILGERFTHLSGQTTISENIGHLRFYVSPQSFLQINSVQSGTLYATALSLLKPAKNETIVDAYCGIGTISLQLAQSCARVIGIEQVASAVEDAKYNASRNEIDNASFYCGKVEDLLGNLLVKTAVSALVLDPPRKGCEEAVLHAIGNSSIQRLLYISCNPSTLARDCKQLHAYGFSLGTIQPVDMFPHSNHIETVAILQRQST